MTVRYPGPVPARQAGVAAIEFAIMAPMLLLVIASVIELGLASRDALRAQAAAAAGSEYAMLNGFDSAAISAAVVNGTGAVGLTASPAPVLFCGCPGTTGIGVAACAATCSDGVNARQYVRVSASINRTTVINAHLGLPAVLVRQSIARLP
jgi:Flp pilus assembly protein TadG